MALACIIQSLSDSSRSEKSRVRQVQEEAVAYLVTIVKPFGIDHSTSLSQRHHTLRPFDSIQDDRKSQPCLVSETQLTFDPKVTGDFDGVEIFISVL